MVHFLAAACSKLSLDMTLKPSRSSTLYPAVRISATRSDRWVDVDLGDEVFIVRVDLGYGYSVSEWSAEEQKELLAEIVDISRQYVEGSFRIEFKKGLFGRRRSFMAINVHSKKFILSKRG